MILQLTGTELKNYFFAEAKGNYDAHLDLIANVKSRIMFFDVSNDTENATHLYFLKMVDSEIVGVLLYVTYALNSDINNCWHLLAYLSVDDKFLQQGISKELIAAFINSERFKPDLGICGVNGYTIEGFHYVHPQIEKLIAKGYQFECNKHPIFPSKKRVKKQSFFKKIYDAIKIRLFGNTSTNNR